MREDQKILRSWWHGLKEWDKFSQKRHKLPHQDRNQQLHKQRKENNWLVFSEKNVWWYNIISWMWINSTTLTQRDKKKKARRIVTVNAAPLVSSPWWQYKQWQWVLDSYSSSPHFVCILPHPSSSSAGHKRSQLKISLRLQNEIFQILLRNPSEVILLPSELLSQPDYSLQFGAPCVKENLCGRNQDGSGENTKCDKNCKA